MMNFTGDTKPFSGMMPFCGMIVGGHIVNRRESASHTPGALLVLWSRDSGALDLLASLQVGGYTSAL